MNTKSKSGTRGNGLLENYLARLRARMAEKKIPEELRSGSILDIGCGSFPVFLSKTRFKTKFGIDKLDSFGESSKDVAVSNGIVFIRQDIMTEQMLPFKEGTFEIVTMLAVIEHLDPNRLSTLIDEIHRILKPGGLFILTTPASWTHGLLKAVSRTPLISHEEIDEHEYQYQRKEVKAFLDSGRFESANIKTGTFEFFMNIWATARK